ncbi:MAG: ATP-binding protein [Candidatus Asgardarchaeia archaeon]
MFIDRQKELITLQEFWDSDSAELCIVYGRRGIGKTTLLYEFSRDKKTVFLVIPEGEWKTISQSIVKQLGEKEFVKFDSFEHFLEYVLSKSSQKTLVVLDEFQRISAALPGATSILQYFWDLKFSKSKIKLVLSGSSIGMMKKETIFYGAPLYGRSSKIIHLKPFDYLNFREFFQKHGITDEHKILMFYSIFGGTPSHLKFIHPQHSLEENLKKILTPEHYLVHEPIYILAQETRAVNRYLAILLAIANGKQTPNDIANSVGIKTTTLPPYLKTLEELDFIQQKMPYGALRNKTKLSRYVISDPYIIFWSKYIYQYMHLIESNRCADLVKIILNDLSNHIGPIFEETTRSIIFTIDLFKDVSNFGHYWDRRGNEIDVVVETKDTLWLGEIKYGQISKEDVAKLIGKINLINAQKKKIALFFVTGRKMEKDYVYFGNYSVKIFSFDDLIQLAKTVS